MLAGRWTLPSADRPSNSFGISRASNDWFWETDAQHRFSAFYSGAEPFSEERINRLRGKTRWELPGPAQDALWAKHRAALDAREPFAGFEYQAIGIDGNPRWMRVAGVPMWSDDGQFLGYRGTASDITARKRTEVALLAALASARALNQRQKDLAELGADWFWETDANHRFVAMWGGRGSDQVAMRKHWIGREPWSRPVQTSPGDVEEWSAYRIAMEARLPFYNLEVSRIAPDGQPGWLSVSAKPRFDLDGTFLGYRGVSSRIDWRKKKEEELAEALQKAESANQRLTDFVGAGTDRFWETDANHRFTDMWGSKVATQLTPSNVMLGRTRWEVSPARNDSEAQMWADHIAKLQAREPFYEFEYPTAQPDGSRRWVSISGVPIFGPDGEFQGYRGRVTDIEDRKKKEAELLAAKQAADAANRAKSEFLATMSHEIRTPMNGIVGLTALALEGPLSADQREHLSAVQQSADGLLAIINDILDLSKIEAGQMQLEATPFDLPEVLSGVLKVVSFNARAKGVELSLDIAADVPRHVIGDPTRVRQVVLNLVGNAIKFTAHGAVTVRARLAQQGPPGMTLRV